MLFLSAPVRLTTPFLLVRMIPTYAAPPKASPKMAVALPVLVMIPTPMMPVFSLM